MLSVVWVLYKARLPLSGVAGVMVSIVAFQAVDPGSIPGPRNVFLFFSQGGVVITAGTERISPL